MSGEHERGPMTEERSAHPEWRPWDTRLQDGRLLLGLFGPDWIEGVYSMPDGSWHWHDGDSRDEPPTHWTDIPEPPEAP